MQEWKIKQKLYHKLNKDYEDDLADVDIEITDDIAFHAIRYFREKDIGWIYPSKSYMVAICFAFWIMEDYDENFYSVLKDPELLPMDPYFVPYADDRKTYDEIISVVCNNNKGKLTTGGMVLDVRKYYDAEIGFEL
jgi:hypothetical protein